MVEASGEASLIQEHLEDFGVFRQVGSDDLEHRELAETNGSVGDGKKHVCHAAFTEFRDDAVFAHVSGGLIQGGTLQHALYSATASSGKRLGRLGG